MFVRTLTIAVLSCTVMGCAMESDDPGTMGESDDLWFAVHNRKS